MATVHVTDGEVISSIIVRAYDDYVIESGGKTIEFTVNQAGSIHVCGGGLVVSTFVKNEGDLSSKFCGTVYVNGEKTSSWKGSSILYGSANATTVQSGGRQIVKSYGQASGTQIKKNGLEIVSEDGYTLSTVVSSGGLQSVTGEKYETEEGAFFSGGTAHGTVVLEGGTQTVTSGGRAQLAQISSGGVQIIGKGGIAALAETKDGDYIGTRVFSGGSQIVSSGGAAYGTVVEDGASMTALSGSFVDAVEVLQGGEVELAKDVDADNLFVYGHLTISGDLAGDSCYVMVECEGGESCEGGYVTGLDYLDEVHAGFTLRSWNGTYKIGESAKEYTGTISVGFDINEKSAGAEYYEVELKIGDKVDFRGVSYSVSSKLNSESDMYELSVTVQNSANQFKSVDFYEKNVKVEYRVHIQYDGKYTFRLNDESFTTSTNFTAEIYNSSGEKVGTSKYYKGSWSGVAAMLTKGNYTVKMQFTSDETGIYSAHLFSTNAQWNQDSITDEDDNPLHLDDKYCYTATLDTGDSICVTGLNPEWVGYNDKIDYREIEITENGLYSVILTKDEADSTDVGLTDITLTFYQLVEGKNTLKSVKKTTIKGADDIGSVSDLLLYSGTYYVSVATPKVNGEYGIAYSVDLTSLQHYNKGKDDGSPYTTENELKVGVECTETVGFGNEYNYYRVEIDSTGLYSIDLWDKTTDALAGIKLGLLTIDSGKQKNVKTITIRNTDTEGSISNQYLTAGTWYVMVQSTNAKKAVEVEYTLEASLTKKYLKGVYGSDFVLSETVFKLAPGAEPIQYKGQVSSVNLQDMFVADLSDGTYTISLKNTESTGNVTVTLYKMNASGMALQKVSSKAAKNEQNISFTASNLAEGRYYIGVTVANANKGTYGEYTLTVSGAKADSSKIKVYDDTNIWRDESKMIVSKDSGTLSLLNPAQYYQFHAEEDGLYTFDTSLDKGSDAKSKVSVTVYELNPAGTGMKKLYSVQVTAAKDGVLSNKLLQADHDYFIEVKNSNKKVDAGYTLSIDAPYEVADNLLSMDDLDSIVSGNANDTQQKLSIDPYGTMADEKVTSMLSSYVLSGLDEKKNENVLLAASFSLS